MVKDPNLLVFFDVDYTLFANMFNVNGEMLSAVPSGIKGKIESAYDDYTKYLLYTNDPYKYVHPLKSVQSFVHGLKRRDDIQIYAISAASSSFDFQFKDKLIKKHYPDIDELITVPSRDMKITVMKCLAEKNALADNCIYFFDDDLQTVMQALHNGICAYTTTNLLWFLHDFLDDYNTVTLDKFVEYFETTPGKMGEINEENESKKYDVIDHSIYDGLIRRSL